MPQIVSVMESYIASTIKLILQLIFKHVASRNRSRITKSLQDRIYTAGRHFLHED